MAQSAFCITEFGIHRPNDLQNEFDLEECSLESFLSIIIHLQLLIFNVISHMTSDLDLEIIVLLQLEGHSACFLAKCFSLLYIFSGTPTWYWVAEPNF